MPDTAPNPAPLIGISGMSTDSKSVAAMVAQVRAMGGIPVVLANHANRDPAIDIEKLDGLIVMGNDFDIDPYKYIGNYPEGDPRRTVHPKTKNIADNRAAQARAVYEEKLIELAIRKNLPTLAVCGGMQTINVMQGGTLLQHIPDLIGNETHDQSKQGIGPFSPVIPVEIEKTSALGTIAGSAHYLYTPSYPPTPGNNVINENSFHHQAIDPDCLGKDLTITAYSDPYTNVKGEIRRLPEAIEPAPDGALKDWPMIGVQWHPEFGASVVSAKLVKAQIERATDYANCQLRDRANDEVFAAAENFKSIVKSGTPTPIRPADPVEIILAPAATPNFTWHIPDTLSR